MAKSLQLGTGGVRGHLGHLRVGGAVCARQKWVVCARQTLVVCACYFCVILSLYLCNMILLVAFCLHIITQLITVWFFSSHLCVGLLFLGLYSLPSPPPPAVAPPLTQLHPSCLTQRTQLISHNSSSHNSHNPSHTTHLSQLNSHNSSHSTHLTQLNSLKSCFCVAFGGAAFVSSH